MLITVGRKTVTGEKTDIGYSHFICFRGGEKKISFLSVHLFTLLIKHFKMVCLSENYIRYFELYYLSSTNNIRMQVKVTVETNSYPDAEYPSSLLHCQGCVAFADCVFFFLGKRSFALQNLPTRSLKVPKEEKDHMSEVSNQLLYAAAAMFKITQDRICTYKLLVHYVYQIDPKTSDAMLQ